MNPKPEQPGRPSQAHPLRLYKKEKLCSAIAIDQLFGGGGAAKVMGALAYPVRMVWRQRPGRRSDATLQFLISEPKKRLRHAVDRVTMRRRIREAYRTNRLDFPLSADSRLDVAFVYVANRLEPYTRIVASMRRLLAQLPSSPCPPESSNP